LPSIPERIVALDLEGDGNHPFSIVEIALIDYKPSGHGQTHQWLVDPRKPINPFVSRIHGLTDQDLQNAPSIDEIANDLRTLVNNAVIVGHDVKGDLKILRRAIPDITPQAIYDTFTLAKLLLPGQPAYGLQKLAANLGLTVPETIPHRGPHSASFDAALSAELFYLMARTAPREFEKALRQTKFVLPHQHQPRFV